MRLVPVEALVAAFALVLTTALPLLFPATAGASAAAAQVLGPTSFAQCCHTWHEQLPAHAAAHAADDAAPAGVSSRPCTTVPDVLMGKSAADSGDEHSQGRSPMKKRQPSLKSDSLRAAQAHAQTLAASAQSSDKDDDDGIYYI